MATSSEYQGIFEGHVTKIIKDNVSSLANVHVALILEYFNFCTCFCHISWSLDTWQTTNVNCGKIKCKGCKTTVCKNCVKICHCGKSFCKSCQNDNRLFSNCIPCDENMCTSCTKKACYACLQKQCVLTECLCGKNICEECCIPCSDCDSFTCQDCCITCVRCLELIGCRFCRFRSALSGLNSNCDCCKGGISTDKSEEICQKCNTFKCGKCERFANMRRLYVSMSKL